MSTIERLMVEIEIENLEAILNSDELGQNGMTVEAVLELISQRMILIGV